MVDSGFVAHQSHDDMVKGIGRIHSSILLSDLKDEAGQPVL